MVDKMDEYMTTILERVLTDNSGQLIPAIRPQVLYHYTSLEVIQRIFEFDSVRLSHAEYSNDRQELRDAIELINGILATNANTPGVGTFSTQVEAAFKSRLDDLDAYIFCMCAGLHGTKAPEDLLSQWRAYAQDGRGGAVALDVAQLSAMAAHLPGLRVNPVVYDGRIKAIFVNAILAEGYKRCQQSGAGCRR